MVGGDAAGDEVSVFVGDGGCGGGTAPSAPCSIVEGDGSYQK